MDKKLGTPEQLMKWLSEELEVDDRGSKFVILNNLTARALFEKGEDILPIIGTYLLGLDTFLQNQHTHSREQIKRGWVLLIHKIVKEYKIPHKKQLPDTFGNIRKWAAEYVPQKES
jgi:hypothetical protein